MLTRRLGTEVPKILKRNIGLAAPALQKASDPIQQLFLDKIREYKSKSPDGKMVDVSPEIEKEKKAELDTILQQFGGATKENMMDFPKFTFTDPTVDVSSMSK